MGETLVEPDLSLSGLAKQALTYGAAVFVQRAASFLLLPIYTRYLTPADYGVLQMVGLTLDIVAIALSAGATAGAMRFYFKEDERERGRVLVTALLLLLAFNALATLLLLVTAPHISDLVIRREDGATLVRLAALGFLFEPLVSVPLILMQARSKARLYSTVSVLRLVLQLSLNIVLLVALGWGVKGVLTSTVVTNLVIGLAMTWWLLRNTGLRPSRRLARILLRYGMPYRLTAAGAFILTFADRFFLERSHGLESVGLYGVAYQFGFLLILASSAPYMQAWAPQRFASIDEPKDVRDDLQNAGFRYFSVVLMTVALGLSVFARPILVLIAAPAFHEAAAIVPVIIAAYVFQAWSDAAEFGIQASERTEYATYSTWCAVVVVLILYATLIPPLGGLGAALATLGAFIVRFICCYAFSQRLWPIAYRWGPHLRLAAYAVLGVVLTRVFEPSHALGQLLWGALVTVAYATLVWWGGVVPGPDRAAALSFLRAGMRRSVPPVTP